MGRDECVREDRNVSQVTRRFTSDVSDPRDASERTDQRACAEQSSECHGCNRTEHQKSCRHLRSCLRPIGQSIEGLSTQSINLRIHPSGPNIGFQRTAIQSHVPIVSIGATDEMTNFTKLMRCDTRWRASRQLLPRKSKSRSTGHLGRALACRPRLACRDAVEANQHRPVPRLLGSTSSGAPASHWPVRRPS